MKSAKPFVLTFSFLWFLCQLWISLVAPAAAQQKTESLLDRALECGTSPFIEGDRALFLYVPGKEKDVQILGDFNGWDCSVKMERDAASGVFFYTLTSVPSNARIEYKFRIDGKEAADPRNPLRIATGMGGDNSCLLMPGYKPLVIPVKKLKGLLKTMQFKSSLLNNTRTVHLYTPPGLTQRESRLYPLLLVHDGTEYLKKGELALIAETLMDQGKIEKLIIVFVDPLDRINEYACDQKFCQFITGELIPFLKSGYPVDSDKMGVMGASMGGLISFYLAFTRPDLFPLVASQSGAFGFVGDDMEKTVETCSKGPGRIYMDVGIYDLRRGKMGLPEENRFMAAALKAKGCEHRYVEFAGGHNWTCWRDQIPAILQYLYGAKQ